MSISRNWLVLPALLLGGLLVTAVPAVASTATAPGHTIATAGTLTIGSEETGGGGVIDFWKVHLTGGDQVQFSTTQPVDEPGTAINTNYSYELYAPGTTDSSFPGATPIIYSDTFGTASTVLVLQAPYTGTFILAVCENAAADNSCGTGSGQNPMDAYTFSTALVDGGVSPAVGAKETRAGTSISGAHVMPVGNFESGGGNAIDLWKIRLTRGDQVRFATAQPVDEPGTAINTDYSYELYAPGTTGSSFPGASPATYSDTFGTANSVFTLRAPSSGIFILAVCENATDNCGTAIAGESLNPMQPYTFTTTLVGGPETATSLRLSPATITYGHEKSLAASVTVTARFGGRRPAGTVTIMAGRKRVCAAKLTRGKGKCHPASGSLLRPGKYSIVAYYGGSKSLARSASKAVSLKIRKR